MSAIESFVNQQQVAVAGESLRPLELVSSTSPVSCFWAAFNGAGAGYLVNEAVHWAVNKYAHGGHHAPEELDALAASATAPMAAMSADRLMAIRGAFES